MDSARYTRSQVASLLHIAPKTLYNWEKEGKIAPPLRDARGWRWYTEEHLGAIRALLMPGRGASGRVGEWASRRRSDPRDEPLPEVAPSPHRPVAPSQDAPPFSLACSARNCLRGTIKQIAADGVTAEVVIDLGHGQEIVAVITRSSVERLGLRVGGPAAAIIKATEVMVARLQEPEE